MEDWTNSASQDPGQRDQRAAGRIGSFARFGASSQACWCRLSLRCQHRSFRTGAFLKTKSSNWDKAYTGAKAPATATIMLEQMVTTAKGAQPSLSNPCAPPGCSARALQAPRLLACKMRTGRCRSQCRSGNGPQLPSHQTLAPSLPPEALGANPCFNHSHRLSISLCRCSWPQPNLHHSHQQHASGRSSSLCHRARFSWTHHGTSQWPVVRFPVLQGSFWSVQRHLFLSRSPFPSSFSFLLLRVPQLAPLYVSFSSHFTFWTTSVHIKFINLNNSLHFAAHVALNHDKFFFRHLPCFVETLWSWFSVGATCSKSKSRFLRGCSNPLSVDSSHCWGTICALWYPPVIA